MTTASTGRSRMTATRAVPKRAAAEPTRRSTTAWPALRSCKTRSRSHRPRGHRGVTRIRRRRVRCVGSQRAATIPTARSPGRRTERSARDSGERSVSFERTARRRGAPARIVQGACKALKGGCQRPRPPKRSPGLWRHITTSGAMMALESDHAQRPDQSCPRRCARGTPAASSERGEIASGIPAWSSDRRGAPSEPGRAADPGKPANRWSCVVSLCQPGRT